MKIALFFMLLFTSLFAQAATHLECGVFEKRYFEDYVCDDDCIAGTTPRHVSSVLLYEGLSILVVKAGMVGYSVDIKGGYVDMEMSYPNQRGEWYSVSQKLPYYPTEKFVLTVPLNPQNENGELVSADLVCQVR